jgi:methylenetetrahydrofolate dehydrogenase (NADP+)/methenyltetrahydrofolate cyclohydrolase
MKTEVLWGKHIADLTVRKVSEEVEKLKSSTGRAPGLAVILAGEEPASQIYVSHKEAACKKAGIRSFCYRLPYSVSEKEILTLIDDLNHRDEADGILVQLPLPEHLVTWKILEAILPSKDVDGFHPLNMGKLALGKEGIVPCTPRGVMALLDHYNIALEGKDVVVVGASNIVGKPLALMLMNIMATVTVCHIKTRDLSQHTRKADIIFTATGVPQLIKREMVKEGCIIIDIGISRLEGKIMGDADYYGLQGWAGAVTPVPGGIGPMTVAMLMLNTLDAFKKRMKTE